VLWSKRMRKTDRVLSAAGALLIVVYFWRLVRPTLHVYFSDDDLMNLYRSWINPLGRLVRANLLFFQSNPFLRPFASAWYRTIFHFAGFHPAPFHAALLAVLFVNLYLTYAVCRRLSGSREIAAVAVLVGCYHERLASLYFDTGFVYDVLCYCFFFAVFLLYIRARQQNRFLKGWEIAVAAALYICALNSKEIAVALPLMLLIYELLYHPPKSWRAVDWRQGLTIFVTGAMTVIFIVGRSMGSDTLLTNEMYKPRLTGAQLLLTSRHFLGYLTGFDETFPASWVLLLWAATFLIAWVSRSRTLKFAWLFLMLSPLPIAFIYPRGPAQYYVPWLGWTLYAATLLVGSIAWLTRRIRPDGFWTGRIRGSVVLLVLIALLYPHWKRLGWSSVASETVAGPTNALIVEQLHHMYPVFPHNARILFLNDPVPADYWNMLFIVRLAYRDDTLTIDCAKRIGRPDDTKLAAYNHVFDYVGGRFFELKRPWRRPPMPMVEVNYFGGEFFHSNWFPVTAGYPAVAGERVISHAVDLGPTDPPVPEGKPFPSDPLLPAISNVEVRVGGRPAPVIMKIGWPGEVGTYRLDFTVPDGVTSGLAAVEVTANGVSGLAADLPVR